VPLQGCTELNGAKEFRSSGALGLVFVLALLFIFLVLSAQFRARPFVSCFRRCDGRPCSHWRPAPERLLADRQSPGRPDQQTRHPDRRVRNQLRRRLAVRGGGHGGQPAPARS
jgi:hypothetical protein